MKIKRAITNVSFAATALMFALTTTFGIQALIQGATGWTPPRWLCVLILAADTAAAVVAIVATFGVSIPVWLARAAAFAGGITA